MVTPISDRSRLSKEAGEQLKKEARFYLMTAMAKFDEQGVDLRGYSSVVPLDLGEGTRDYMIVGVRYPTSQMGDYIISVSSSDEEDASGDVQILVNLETSEFVKL